MSQADACYSALQKEVDTFLLKKNPKWILADKCARIKLYEEENPTCKGLDAEMTRCGCTNRKCFQFTKKEEYRTDVNTACKKYCLKVFEMLNSLQHCVKDPPVLKLREGKYNTVCSYWSQVNVCLFKLSHAYGDCDKVRIRIMSKVIIKMEFKTVEEYNWFDSTSDKLCNENCIKTNTNGHKALLTRAETCAVLFREALSLDHESAPFCRKIAEVFECVEHSKSLDCLSVLKIMQTVYRNFTTYVDMPEEKCPDILASTASPTTVESTLKTLASQPDVTTAKRMLSTTTDDGSKAADAAKLSNGPWKPCKAHAVYHNGGYAPRFVGWVLSLTVVLHFA